MRPAMPMTCAAMATLLSLAAAPAGAEALRWTDGAGRVHYGDRASAPPGAAEPVPDRVSAGAVASIPAEDIDAARERARERRQALEEAHAGVAAAQSRLDGAQRRREAGVEPLPGERLGIAGGGARLAPRYFERQAALEAEHRAAKAALDEAVANLNRLR